MSFSCPVFLYARHGGGVIYLSIIIIIIIVSIWFCVFSFWRKGETLLHIPENSAAARSPVLIPHEKNGRRQEERKKTLLFFFFGPSWLFSGRLVSFYLTVALHSRVVLMLLLQLLMQARSQPPSTHRMFDWPSMYATLVDYPTAGALDLY